jgi:predicted nucleic acid-binding Zn finger protein
MLRGSFLGLSCCHIFGAKVAIFAERYRYFMALMKYSQELRQLAACPIVFGFGEM